MFSLIVTIVSIVLVIGLALATVYWIGNTTDDAQARALASRYINSAEQIRGSVDMYKTEHGGAMPASLDDLVNANYLTTIPRGEWSLQNTGTEVTLSNLDQKVCENLNRQYTGDSTIKSCSDPTLGPAACCQE